MSKARHAPYGADDDPFLTHPAGPGVGQRHAPNSDYWVEGRQASAGYGYDAPRHAGFNPAPQTRHAAPTPPVGYDQGAYDQVGYAQHEYGHAPYGQDRFGRETYGQDTYGHQAQEHGHGAAPYSAPQQSGNFRPRATSYAPQPQSHPVARPIYGMQADYAQPSYDGFDPPNPLPHSPNPRSFSAPPRYAPARGPAAHPMAAAAAPQQAEAGHSYDHPYGDLRASFALPNVQAGQWMQWAGALCTVLAVLGAGYWGYNLAVRDANGIPVVRATLGPLRLAPETPGGEVSAHQGLAVNAIPATGASAPMPDQIILAPQTIDLAQQDTTLTEAGSFAATTTITTSGADQIESLAGASDQILAQPQAAGSALADLADLPNSLPEDMPLTDAEAVERALEAALDEGGDPIVDTAQASDAAPVEPASMSNTNPVVPPTAELDPASIPLGTPMVQFGAFDTAETARAEWANLQTRFTELMTGKALVVEQAKSGGRDFFRLRAHGFDSADDTRRFCAAILAENGTCLTVDQR